MATSGCFQLNANIIFVRNSTKVPYCSVKAVIPTVKTDFRSCQYLIYVPGLHILDTVICQSVHGSKYVGKGLLAL